MAEEHLSKVEIMYGKDKAKEEVKRLVEKYNHLVESGKLKSYNEEMTKKDFILPLFRVLGWDVENGEEVTAEEHISKGRVDYAFRIEDIPKLFLEAKALKADLEQVEFAQQAINYAWHKGATWAVLTDFEGVKVFNAEWKLSNPLQNMFFSIKCYQFLERFDQLWLLSRESLEKGLIDEEAEKWGKKAKKIPVDKQLLSDLTKSRELLTKNILKCNSGKNLTGDELDEAVQRILDRLLFIRTLEDKQLEAPVLQALIREETHNKIYKKLNSLFRKIDDVYNSKLFRPHICEELVLDDDVLEKIIRGLFKTADNTVHYDFSAIDADVLGNMYEQYLGHILKKTAKRASLSSDKAHRKEQGIYYTPTYVVDYIVKNTVGELAKTKKFDLKNIKVLDPACGSGSFLMKAFDYLVTLDKKKNGDIDQTKLDLTGESTTYGKKVEILKNNIFGVDLDPKAVEIAQLNLLLKAAEKKHRLPTLQENIKVGNSLIDDPEVAGNKAFKWKEEFKEIMDKGGFDVVIGNPPYVRIQNLKYEEIDYYKKNYTSAYQRTDIYLMFYERALSLLNEGGRIGFISSVQFINSKYGIGLRKLLLENRIIEIIDFGDLPVFSDAVTYTGIFIIEKGKPKDFKYLRIKNLEGINQQIQKARRTTISVKKLSEKEWVLESDDTKKVLEKIRDNTKLGQIAIVNTGCFTGKDDAFFVDDKTIKENKLEEEIIKPVILGKEPKRYHLSKPKRKAIYPYRLSGQKTEIIPELDLKKKYPKIFIYLQKHKKELLSRSDSRVKFSKGTKVWYSYTRKGLLNIFNSKKIIVGYITNTNNFCYDDFGYIYGVGRAFGIVPNNSEYPINYLLGILCSKLSYFLMKRECPIKKGGFFKISSEYLNNFPIKNIPIEKQEKLIKFVKEMSTLKEKLILLAGKHTDEKARLEKEIEKLDNQIDQEVYRIYGLTKEEIGIVGESFK